MKTAQEWAKELRRAASVAPNGTLVMIEPWLKQVQLDAMKEGMRRASEIFICSKPWASKAILTAAEQLTEKDL